jgi:hypothetical protein
METMMNEMLAMVVSRVISGMMVFGVVACALTTAAWMAAGITRCER